MPSTQVSVINVPDMVLGLVLIVGLFLGLVVGLYRQAIVLVASYVAALVASRVYPLLTSSIPLSISPSSTVRSAVAFGLLFVALVIFLAWLTHYIPNPIGMTSHLTFLSGRAGAAVLGLVWAFLIIGVSVTVLVLALGASWGIDNEQTQLQLKSGLRQSTVVQILRMYVWPISEVAQDVLPLGPFLPS